jgi:hypothetical protein
MGALLVVSDTREKQQGIVGKLTAWIWIHSGVRLLLSKVLRMMIVGGARGRLTRSVGGGGRAC